MERRGHPFEPWLENDLCYIIDVIHIFGPWSPQSSVAVAYVGAYRTPVPPSPVASATVIAGPAAGILVPRLVPG